jgi:hypothetical protein
MEWRGKQRQGQQGSALDTICKQSVATVAAVGMLSNCTPNGSSCIAPATPPNITAFGMMPRAQLLASF